MWKNGYGASIVSMLTLTHYHQKWCSLEIICVTQIKTVDVMMVLYKKTKQNKTSVPKFIEVYSISVETKVHISWWVLK